MKLTGLHLLLTYQCTYECDHCFAWGSPWQRGTMTLEVVRRILSEAEALGTVREIYFEGGEPFLYHPVLVAGVNEAFERGFSVGIVSNGYWATSVEDALEWLRPLAGKLADLSVSCDLYHASEEITAQIEAVREAAERLGLPCGSIRIAQPEEGHAAPGAVMCRGRAVEKLADKIAHRPWNTLTSCEHETLDDPGRLHVDPLGNLHVCQGICVGGNLLENRLAELWAAHDPRAHPILGPLLEGGPAELARRYGFEPEAEYADACHLCYETRRALRDRFPETLQPDQMYGVLA